jgi:hypothetical protein
VGLPEEKHPSGGKTAVDAPSVYGVRAFKRISIDNSFYLARADTGKRFQVWQNRVWLFIFGQECSSPFYTESTEIP